MKKILQHQNRNCYPWSTVLVLAFLLVGASVLADEQSLTDEWSQLISRCQQRSDEANESVPDEGSLPNRPVRRLGSEFLGKRTTPPEQLCIGLASSEEVDQDWFCHCIRRWNQPVSLELDDEPAPEVNKRGLGAILLSGKRMNNNKWNNNLNRRVMGSEFLGKRAIMGSEFLGKRALGSEFLGKRAMMGSEFLGKRGNTGRINRLNGPPGIPKI